MGIGYLEGPGLVRFDVNLVKRIRISEGTEFEFRADAIDVLNRTNFANPDNNINSTTFGRITEASGGKPNHRAERKDQFLIGNQTPRIVGGLMPSRRRGVPAIIMVLWIGMAGIAAPGPTPPRITGPIAATATPGINLATIRSLRPGISPRNRTTLKKNSSSRAWPLNTPAIRM